MASDPTNRRPLLTAGTFLGIGMGGFVDGIVFHQLLQTHNMLSARLPKDNVVNMQVNMFWDGLFHVFTWITTAVGLGLLWQAGGRADVPWVTRLFVGSLILGWGIFNLVEGLIDHQLLGVHHVRDDLGGPLSWDLGFLAFGALLLAAGAALVRAGRRDQCAGGVPDAGIGGSRS